MSSAFAIRGGLRAPWLRQQTRSGAPDRSGYEATHAKWLQSNRLLTHSSEHSVVHRWSLIGVGRTDGPLRATR